MDSRVLLEDAHSWPWTKPLMEPAGHRRLVRLRSLIVVTVLSLNLWTAAIWAAVATFASAA
jgi:hypothetical protein